MLGAVATLLDMIFKPGIAIRILGGSLDQSLKMHTYLREMLESDTFVDLLDGRPTGRRVQLTNGSHVELLAQSEQSVRGHRVQKLRCDEVELFTPEVWQAAQFVTRSAMCGDVFVPGCIEALSTMHRPFGMMSRLVSEAESRRVFRWGLLEVLERCEPSRACEGCRLWPECGGVARDANGFFHIQDALQQKDRSGLEAWQAEMLCERPSRSDCVYPHFSLNDHVGDVRVDALRHAVSCGQDESQRGYGVGGMDFGFRSPTVFLWGWVRRDGVLCIFDEHVGSEMTIGEHIGIVRSRHGWFEPAWIGIDPAGYQRHEHLGRSTASLLKEAGFLLRSRRSDLASGIRGVQTRLRRADGSIGLMIDAQCERLIEAMQRYHYSPDRPEDESPVKDGSDHACDALRYLITNLDRGGQKPTINRY